MKISLITVCWNSAATIRTAMDSVWRQTGVEVEYLVVDGGSTDGTVEIVKEYAVRAEQEKRGDFSFRWISEKDNGMYDAINKGIRMATGDVVGILNADDVLDGDEVLAKVAAQFEALERKAGHPLEGLYGNVRFVRELGGKTVRVCFARWWKPWMLQWGYMPPHPAIFIRRACFAQWGGYVGDRKAYKIAADYELLIRYFRVHRLKARYMKVCTTVMRMGGMSTKDVDARKRLNREIIKGNRANGYFCCWPMLLPKYAVKIWEVILPRLGLM